MARRFTTSLVDAARDGGLIGARIHHRRSGPHLVGILGGMALAIPLPGAAGQSISDISARRRLVAALAAAHQTGGPVAPWPFRPSDRRQTRAQPGGRWHNQT